MKKQHILIITFLILLSISVFAIMQAKAQNATIWTDKADYYPKETVTIYGTGFLPNANITVNVIKQADGTVSSFNVISDSNGNFTTTYQIDNVGAPLYSITAADGTNTATTTFTDASQYVMTVSYSVTGGGSPTAPILHYVDANGNSKADPINTTATQVIMGTGVAWSVTPNPLTGSTSSERWYSNDTLSGATPPSGGTGTFVFTYHHQYQVTFSQSGVDSSAGSNTVLTVGSTPYTYNGLPSSVYADSGTMFSWAPSVSGGAGKQFVLTGSFGVSPITAAATYSATYKTQYQVTFAVSPSGSGSTSPAGSNVWEDAGSLSISAIANSSYTFSTWSSNTGSITFNNVNSASTTATISGPGTITSHFLIDLDHFVFSTISSPQTAGSAFSIAVTAKNASGSTVTAYTGTPSLSYSAGSITPSTMNAFVKGVGSISVTVTTAGSSVNITAIDGTHTGASNPFMVVHASIVDHIAISLNPTSVVAPGTVIGTATAYDSYDNSWDVSTLASWRIPAGGDGGSWSSNVYTSHNAGTYTVQGSYSGKTATTSLTVNVGTLDHITAYVTPTSVAAGSTSTGTATAFDAQNNSLGVVSASWSIPVGGDGGSWSGYVYTSHTAGTFIVRASYLGKTATASLTVNPAGLDNFAFDAVADQIAGSAFSINVTAKDGYGNTVTSYVGTPSLSYSAGSITPSTMNAFVNGVGSILVTVTTAGSNVTITAVDGTRAGISNSFTVTITPTPTPRSTQTPTSTPKPTAKPPTPTATPSPTPTPTPSPDLITKLIKATLSDNSTVYLIIYGNINGSDISNVAITTDQTTAKTTITLTLIGQNGANSFCNLTLPKGAIPYGTLPAVYVNNQIVNDQGHAQDANNYYVWFNSYYSTYELSIEFKATSTVPLWAIGAVIIVSIVLVLAIIIPRLDIREKTRFFNR